MKRLTSIVLFSILVAIANFGLSFVADLNLVWIIGMALIMSDSESEAVVLTVLSGFLFDVMMHGHIGITSLSFLVPAFLLVIVKSIGFGDRSWQKFIISFVFFFLIVIFELVLRQLIGESGGLSGSAIGHSVGKIVLNGFVSLVVYGLIELWHYQHPERKAIKV
ncbi:rod shape-determining protein MreD [Candidatus Dojkabacteria bacterium]|nr:rod shape-determining protein MreD [Candidatus Dojkabacteria bacterium]